MSADSLVAAVKIGGVMREVSAARRRRQRNAARAVIGRRGLLQVLRAAAEGFFNSEQLVKDSMVISSSLRVCVFVRVSVEMTEPRTSLQHWILD